MARSRTDGPATNRTALSHRVIVGMVAFLALVLAGPAVSAATTTDAAIDALSEEDKTCLSCHGLEGMEKDLADGDTLPLYIAGDAFAGSVHTEAGCAGCHAEVELENHPAETVIDSRHAYSLQASRVCTGCHAPESLAEGPAHHARVANVAEPVCSQCHDAHAVTPTDQWKAEIAETDYCVTCHEQTLTVSLVDDESRPPSVDQAALRDSVHLNHDCTDCHGDFSKDAHAAQTQVSARAHSIELAGTCRSCHEEKYTQFKGSIHATLLDEGSLVAPVCTDCHGAHSVGPKAAYETIAGVPCRGCHTAIFDAYLGSMHGQARGEQGHMAAPICADCHQAHEVAVASTNARLKDACLGCHQDAAATHGEWLPNTALHLEAVSCPACHAPKAQRRVDLKLYDGVAQKPVSDSAEWSKLEQRMQSADGEGNGLDAMELWSLVRKINREGTAADMTLRGRMVVSNGIEAHQLARKTEAIRDCETCHHDGAQPFQSVTISIVRPDGRPLRYDANNEVLNSAVSVDSLGGFYAIGGTRIKLMDVLLVVAVLGGISVPLGHMTLRRLFRNSRSKEK